MANATAGESLQSSCSHQLSRMTAHAPSLIDLSLYLRRIRALPEASQEAAWEAFEKLKTARRLADGPDESRNRAWRPIMRERRRTLETLLERLERGTIKN